MPHITTQNGKYHYKSVPVYLGIKQIDKRQAYENLQLLDSFLHAEQLPFGPIFGTMLGMVRDNDFITWDEDIDLYVKEEYEEQLKLLFPKMEQLGFKLIRYERCGLYSIMRKGEYIDFYILKRVNSQVRVTIGHCFLLEDWVNDTIPFHFKELDLNIPRNFEQCLTITYGDWRTPVKYTTFELSALQRAKAKLVFWIKQQLPDGLFFKLFRRHHTPSIQKFESRCRQQGVALLEPITLDCYKK